MFTDRSICNGTTPIALIRNPDVSPLSMLNAQNLGRKDGVAVHVYNPDRVIEYVGIVQVGPGRSS